MTSTQDHKVLNGEAIELCRQQISAISKCPSAMCSAIATFFSVLLSDGLTDSACCAVSQAHTLWSFPRSGGGATHCIEHGWAALHRAASSTAGKLAF